MTDIRLASDNRFPYDWPGHVCYLELRDDQIEWLKTRDETRAAVTRACTGESVIYAAWPGQWKTDLFVIDDPQQLADALGMKTGKATART